MKTQRRLTFKIDDGLTARISKPKVCRAGKLCWRFCVGASVATDLAKPEAEPPSGGEALIVCYVQ
ncbi:MAG: hypothetical protein FWC64_01760 [Treponema sp.]|nr:hypothetical protein [Treponema sp.]